MRAKFRSWRNIAYSHGKGLLVLLAALLLLNGCLMSEKPLLTESELVTPLPERFTALALPITGQQTDPKSLDRYSGRRQGKSYILTAVREGKSADMLISFAPLGGEKDVLLMQVQIDAAQPESLYQIALMTPKGIALLDVPQAKIKDTLATLQAAKLPVTGDNTSIAFRQRQDLFAAMRLLAQQDRVEPVGAYLLGTTPQEVAQIEAAVREVASRPAAPPQPAAPAAAAPPPVARAEPGAERVHACDEQAAHPRDRDRMAPGVEMQRIVPRLALQECRRAVAEFPGTARFRFQLGRAMLAAQDQGAVSMLQQAGEMGHAYAWVSLGNTYANDSRGPADDEAAAAALRKAAAAGIDVREDLARVTFWPEGYSNPAFFKAVWDGQGAAVNRQNSLYLQHFLTMFRSTGDCVRVVNDRFFGRLSQQASMDMLGNMLGGLAGAQRGRSGNLDNAFSEGLAAGQAFTGGLIGSTADAKTDAQLFYDRHGCDSPVARRFFGNLQQ
jgi:hypothetical protein